ncbi:hypothetical protein COY87_00915 [Candidatus Roizmanbacteria bacterium CG_4_10_14_0_8_um_filter_33_9]|uniref:Radical SAM core domain-containing protein n=1 Tax=Candidatus Roizmanbacteria bacterium CG_4_10_14_0_8_um_filter_33_9 TaxID=1974826 RepID=A0A2M7QKJ3_9BACT|nr:MAG: hypothetical protein COY87_00915 [Candidatus Roizmanbacteria bacterium CG_4_10_14_0_8_um_filter_33_9]
MEKRQFIDPNIVARLRPKYGDKPMAWVPGSTPPDLTQAMIELGFTAPEMPTLDEIFRYPRTAAEAYLTRTCALNCDGCSVPDYIRWAREDRLDDGVWEEKMWDLARRGLLAVKFIGGEVGGLRSLPNVAKAAVDAGMKVSIFTDGVPFITDPSKLDTIMNATGGKVTWMTSTDFLPPTHAMQREAGQNEDTARVFKAMQGYDFIKLIRERGGIVVAHMMLHKSNAGIITNLYEEVVGRGAMFSIGTMQVAAHLYQGRKPEGYTNALSLEDQDLIARQMGELIRTEQRSIAKGNFRSLANSEAHLGTMHTVGITQHIGCANVLGPPAVFPIMPDGAARHCPVVQTYDQVRACPGCAYAVFRDGDERWGRYLITTDEYKSSTGSPFPSLFYPTADNNFLQGTYGRNT